MNTQEDYRPVASCMALTVRKEHRLLKELQEKLFVFLGKHYCMPYS